jgi:cytochrome subunit of sulfide dehydrogenase
MKPVGGRHVIGPVAAIISAAVGLAWSGIATAAGVANAPPGALSCSGCHASAASVETPVPRLAGRDANAVVAAMQAFRAGQMPATVMDRIAKGFTDEEIQAIAAWYAAQKD